MAKETIIPLKFNRGMTPDELNELIQHLYEYELKHKVDCTIISMSAVANRVKDKRPNENSGLHIADVSGSAPIKAENYVKEYFKLPENWNEKDKLPNGTDIGIIVDLLVGFAEKHYR